MLATVLATVLGGVLAAGLPEPAEPAEGQPGPGRPAGQRRLVRLPQAAAQLGENVQAGRDASDPDARVPLRQDAGQPVAAPPVAQPGPADVPVVLRRNR